MNTEEFVDMLAKDMSQSNDPMDIFIESDVAETDRPTEDGLDDDDDEVLDNWIEGIDETPDGTVSDRELVNTLLRKCRGLISFIKRSTILTAYVASARRNFSIKRNLSINVCTRWNSTFYLIDSFIVSCDVVERLFKSKHRLQIKQHHLDRLPNLELTSDDWIMLSQLHGISQPFFHATRAMSRCPYPTISFTYYLIVCLKILLQNQSKNNNPLFTTLEIVTFE